MATLRIKSQWFKPEQARNPQQTGSAMAFIAFRVSVNMLKRMRDAGFDIDAGPAYFGFVREVLLFLVTGIDRLASERLPADERAAFTGAMVRRVGEFLEENEADLLGPRPAAGDDYRGLFIEQFNLLAEHYAEFGWSAAEGPDFGAMRYLGSRIEPLLPDKDRNWVIDQVMAIEAPDAVDMIQRAMADVFSTEPRRARRERTTGE